MTAVDVLLLTSKREGSPNSFKGAMSCNLPIVSTNVGNVHTQISGASPIVIGTNYHEYLSGLFSILRNGGRPAGRTQAERFSWDRIRKRIIRMHKKALETGRSQ